MCEYILEDGLFRYEVCFPIFAKFYDFGDGAKLYIIFGSNVRKGDLDEHYDDWTVEPNDIRILKRNCGSSINNVKDVVYEGEWESRIYYTGIDLPKLERNAKKYINTHPVIRKAIKGLTPSEINEKYEIETDIPFSSKAVDVDVLTNIVEYNDIFDYDNGYFLKCFNDIDEFVDTISAMGTIVDILNSVRNNKFLKK